MIWFYTSWWVWLEIGTQVTAPHIWLERMFLKKNKKRKQISFIFFLLSDERDSSLLVISKYYFFYYYCCLYLVFKLIWKNSMNEKNGEEFSNVDSRWVNQLFEAEVESLYRRAGTGQLYLSSSVFLWEPPVWNKFLLHEEMLKVDA